MVGRMERLGRVGAVVVVVSDAVWGCVFSRLTATVRVKVSVRFWRSHTKQEVLRTSNRDSVACRATIRSVTLRGEESTSTARDAMLFSLTEAGAACLAHYFPTPSFGTLDLYLMTRDLFP